MHQMLSESTLVRAAVARTVMTPYDAGVRRGRFKASLLEEGMSGGPRLEAIMSIWGWNRFRLGDRLFDHTYPP